MKAVILPLLSLSFIFSQLEYSWENGGTILGTYGNLADPQNVGPENGVTPYDGDFMLKVSESPLDGTPQAFLAWVTNINDGDEIEACFYGYDDTPGTSPSLRIWGSWSDNDDITAYGGSADGNTNYTDGPGWSQVCHTFSTTQGNWNAGEALVIQARLYSSSSGSDPTNYYIDLLTVAAPSTVSINLPGETEISGCTDQTAANYNFNATSDDGSCLYASDATLYQVQHATEVDGEWDTDCYPSPLIDQYVNITGVVSAVKPPYYDTNGSLVDNPFFFIQDPSSDGWGGGYVFDSSVDPTVGDELEMTVLIEEYFGLTELTEVSNVEVLSTGNGISPLNISTSDLATTCNLTSEMYEGMLVKFTDITIESIDAEYGGWYVDDGSGQAKVDDYFFDGEWPDVLVGDSFTSVVGVAHYAYGEYAIYPRFFADFQTDSSLPVANAGQDQAVGPGDTVTLDGSGSYDGNGNIISYEWVQVGGTTVTLANEESMSTTFTAPDVSEDLVFRLTVWDNDINEDTDEITVSISAPLSIYDIQYTTEQGTYCYETAMSGETVSVSGIVTHITPFTDFFLQDPDGETWSGVFVYDNTMDIIPQLGDELALTATVNEYYSFTQLLDVTASTVLSIGNTIDPTPLTVADIGIDCSQDGEMYESMLINYSNITFDSVDEYGNWTISDGTGNAMVDDYYFDGNWPAISAGDSFECIAGILGYSYSEFKLYPRNISDFNCDGGGCVADGDVTGDDNLNVLDIVQIVSYIIGEQEFSDEQICKADLSGDGGLNVIDIVQMVAIIIGNL